MTMNVRQARAWQAVLRGPDGVRALNIARQVGDRLRDPDRMSRSIQSVSEQTGWAQEPVSLADGHPGLALAFAQLDRCFPGEGWDDDAHRQVELTVAALRGNPGVEGGLFVGLSGVAFAAQFVDSERYARLLGTLDGLIVRHSAKMIGQLDRRERGCAEDDYDLIFGLTGIGAYLLTRGDATLLDPVLARLAALFSGIDAVPGWYMPPELLDEDRRSECPGGRLNCGLAHGAPGPLALFAVARLAGFDTPGLTSAIAQLSTWLTAQVVEDEWGRNWPAWVPAGAQPAAQPGARAAWCYGAPGVARTLWLAGEALDDDGLKALAVTALEAVYRRPLAELRINGPTFCHGTPGLLQVALRMAHDSGSAVLRHAAAGQALSLMEQFKPGSLFGFQDTEPSREPLDSFGLLTGAAGAMLALLAASTSVAPDWDRAFLLG